MDDLTTDAAASTWRFQFLKRIELMKRLMLTFKEKFNLSFHIDADILF